MPDKSWRHIFKTSYSGNNNPGVERPQQATSNLHSPSTQIVITPILKPPVTKESTSNYSHIHRDIKNVVILISIAVFVLIILFFIMK